MSVYDEQQLRIIKLTKPSIIAFKANEKGIRYKSRNTVDGVIKIPIPL
jgi:hypothetical protein